MNRHVRVCPANPANQQCQICNQYVHFMLMTDHLAEHVAERDKLALQLAQ